MLFVKLVREEEKTIEVFEKDLKIAYTLCHLLGVKNVKGKHLKSNYAKDRYNLTFKIDEETFSDFKEQFSYECGYMIEVIY